MNIEVKDSFREVIFGGGDIDATIDVRQGARCELLLVGVGSGKIQARVESGGVLRVVEVITSSVCREIEFDLVQVGARCEIFGVEIIGEKEVVEIRSEVRHLSEGCQSEQCFRIVAGGEARSSFEGMIFVDRGAQSTEAVQQSDAIVLGNSAVVNSSPQLEIYADDVKCNHGSTVGRQDESALFYMRQRGIAPSDAQELLLHSFCNKALRIEQYDSETIDRVQQIIVDSIRCQSAG